MKPRKDQLIKTKIFCLGAISALFISLFSCDQKELMAEEIINRSIETHGGIEKWNSLKGLEFDKRTILFHPDGLVESDVIQHQSFDFSPRRIQKISYTNQDSLKVSLLSDEGYIHHVVGGFPVTDSLELRKAESALKAAYFVASQPFDLLKSGATFSNHGIMQIGDIEAYEIGVTYPSDTSDSDKWSFLIDVNDFKVVANKVILSDHSSWVDNLKYDESTGFLFNSHRKSYRLDAEGHKTYLRAEYFYSNFKVRY